MSYDHNVYVGWYAEFEQNHEKVQKGTKTARQCPENTNHPAKDDFCSKCGSKIELVEVPTYKNFESAWNLYNMSHDSDTTNEEIKEATLGYATLEDLKKVTKNSHMAFPEFFSDKKVRILAPGYIRCGDIGRRNSFAEDVLMRAEPTEEWQELLKKVFKPKNLEIKYGIVHEVW